MLWGKSIATRGRSSIPFCSRRAATGYARGCECPRTWGVRRPLRARAPPGGAGRKEEAAAEYEETVALYRGDYLAEDLYEDWTMIERERLTNAYVDAPDRLADHHAELGRLREAVRNWHRMLEKDPCHERTHRRLMEYYVRLGLRGRALLQYRLCCTILEHACEMEPSPETVSLYNRLLGDRGA
jgi:DNA-binding SARP family transcriptional activator